MIILKIALRNLLEHKVKTVIVGTLIAFAVIFMVTGNSILGSISTGLKQSYSHNYTGDLIVHGLSEEDFSLVDMGGASGEIPLLPAYAELRSAAESLPRTVAVLPLISGSGTISVAEESAGFTQLWGVDFGEYKAMFPDSLAITEGSFPEQQGAYILLSESVREEAEKETGKKISVGDKITLGGFGSGGTRLREVEVAAVFHFTRGSEQLNRISIMDANTLRSLKGMTVAEPATPTAPAAPKADSSLASAIPVMSDESEDELFGGSQSLLGNQKVKSGKNDEANYESILGDTSSRFLYSAVDSDAWNFLLVRLSSSADFPEAKKALDEVILGTGSEAAVSDWQWGSRRRGKARHRYPVDIQHHHYRYPDRRGDNHHEHSCHFGNRAHSGNRDYSRYRREQNFRA